MNKSCLFPYVREKIRTPDTLVRSQVLYPAELRTHIQFIVSETRYNAGDRNRTGTVFLQQDFKSCASASSATPAFPICIASYVQRPSLTSYLKMSSYRTIHNGQRWIRTTEANCSRFTVCPLWPLGNLPIYQIRKMRSDKKRL